MVATVSTFRNFLSASLLVTGLAVAGCQAVSGDLPTDPGVGRVAAAASEPQNWLSYNGNYDEQRFSELKRINTENIGNLGLAWSFDFDTARGQEATPLVVDGVIYTTTAWNKVYALDAVTGKQLWKYDPEVPGRFGVNACCDVINRGAAYDNGKIFFQILQATSL